MGRVGKCVDKAECSGLFSQHKERAVRSGDLAEATLALPLIAGYAYGKGNWKSCSGRQLAKLSNQSQPSSVSV